MSESANALRCTEERIHSLKLELELVTHDLSLVKSEPVTTSNKVKEMEEDAGVEFRRRIRGLTHQLPYANS